MEQARSAGSLVLRPGVSFNGVKVFSATMFADRDQLGEKVTPAGRTLAGGGSTSGALAGGCLASRSRTTTTGCRRPSCCTATCRRATCSATRP